MIKFSSFLATILMGFCIHTFAADNLSSDSIYHVTSKWRTSENKEIHLRDFSGNEVIMTMAYTGCTYTCPMTVAKLKEIEADLKKRKISNYKIVVASFDPVRDTPNQLQKYMKDKKLDPAAWVFLSPLSDKEVRELAAVLGITYSKDKTGEYGHSNVISLLDDSGVVRERVNGLAADHKAIVTRLAKK